MTGESQRSHILGYGTLWSVWAALMALTALTVWVSRRNIGIGHVWGALAIASVKSALVIAYFMHMRYENNQLRWFLFIALLTLGIFIGFTFFDTVYR